MTASDVVLTLCAVPAFTFTLSYGILSPWYRSALGWVMFLYALAVDALLSLIIYAIAFGQKVDEPWRLLVATALLFALSAKTTILSTERRAGRQRRRAREEEAK